MTLIDILTSAWAILPEKLLEIQEIYATHLRGEKIDVAGIEARLGRSLANEQKAYTVESGGVGVLSAIGVMAPRANMFMQISGGISTSMLAKQFGAMQDDPRVRTALLVADSPGGQVLGIPAAVDALRSLSAAKTTVVVGEGTIASAMYWVASAANAVFIEGATDMVGSLGVVTRLGWDKPKDNQVELVRGKYKRASADGKAPSPHALAQANDQLDYLYGLLIDSVAQHRGVSSEDVLDKMADGRVFIGQQAMNAGLVDGFSTVDAMVERMATKPDEFSKRRKAVFVVPTPSLPPSANAPAGVAEASAAAQQPADPVSIEGSTSTSQGASMATEIKAATRELLQAENPVLFAALQTAFMAEGAAAEAARVKSVREQLVPGNEVLIDKLATDGKSTGADAAMAIVAATKAQMAAAAAAHINDAPAAAKTDASGAAAGSGTEKTKAEWTAEAKAYAAKNNVGFMAALKAIGYPD
jgi:ClpP class serine protease